MITYSRISKKGLSASSFFDDVIVVVSDEPAPSAPLQPEGGDLTFYDPAAPEIIGGGEEEIPAMAATTSTIPDPDEFHECIVGGCFYSFKNKSAGQYISMWGYDSDNYLSHSVSRGYEETFELVDVYDDNGDLIAFKIKTVGHEDHDDGEPVMEYYLTTNDDSGTVYAADETSSLTEAQSWKIYSVDEDSFAIGISKPLAANETIKVLTMNPNVNGNGYYYSVAPYTGSNNQRWYVYSADQQLYRDSMNLRDGSYAYRVHT